MPGYTDDIEDEDEMEEDEHCDWCGDWESGSARVAVEYKTEGWDPCRDRDDSFPSGYGLIGGPCEYCGRYLGFEEADAAYARAEGPEVPTGSMLDKTRRLAAELGLEAGAVEGLIQHYGGRPMT